MAQKLWGPEQDGILRCHYGKMTVAELIRRHLPGWNENTILNHASALGLTRNRPISKDRWTNAEDTIVRRWYGKTTIREIKAKYLPRRTINAIQARAFTLGLKSRIPHEPWTEAEDDIIRKHYAAIPIQDLVGMLPGRTASDIESRVRALGLEQGQHNIQAWRQYRLLTNGGTHGTNLTLLKKKEPNKNNATGVRGVTFDKQKGKYLAYVGFQGKQYRLGYYPTIEEAAKARAEGMEKLQPILDAIKADIAGMKDELVAQAVRTAAELRQAARESLGDAARSKETE